MDEELSDLVRNIAFAVVIVAIFTIALILVFLRIGGDGSLQKKIQEKNDFIIFVHKNQCDNCSEIKRVLRNNNIYYETINTTTEKQYETILKMMEIEKSDIIEPSLVIVKEGKVDSILVDIEKIDDLKDFIEYNNLSN